MEIKIHVFYIDLIEKKDVDVLAVQRMRMHKEDLHIGPGIAYLFQNSLIKLNLTDALLSFLINVPLICGHLVSINNTILTTNRSTIKNSKYNGHQ